MAGVLVQTPNIYGALEDLSGWAEMIHAAGARLIVSANPLSLGALTSPAEWSADIAVGDTQPLGLPPCFGGPSAGYIACTEELMRRMPGRIVGETLDSEGRRAFVLTLQAREQHIKRERATSNICSNQSLAALANTIYLAAVGPKGFAEVSRRNIEAAGALREKLVGDLGIEDYTAGAVFNEFTLRIPVPREVWEAPFEAAGIASGVWLADLDFSPAAGSVNDCRYRETHRFGIGTLHRVRPGGLEMKTHVNQDANQKAAAGFSGSSRNPPGGQKAEHHSKPPEPERPATASPTPIGRAPYRPRPYRPP